MADLYELDRLEEIAERLGSDEIEVLIQIANRILTGQEAYGAFDLDTDPRDFDGEAAEEAQDALVYLAAGKIRASRQRSRGRR